MKLAYVDSSVWITRIEGLPAYQSLVHDYLRAIKANGWQLCISDAVLLEVLAKPRQENRQDLITFYSQFFQRLHRLVTFEEVFRNALIVAEADRLKGLDALHVAFAAKYNCGCSVTTDPDFKTLKSLPLHWIDLSESTPA